MCMVRALGKDADEEKDVFRNYKYTFIVICFPVYIIFFCKKSFVF